MSSRVHSAQTCSVASKRSASGASGVVSEKGVGMLTDIVSHAPTGCQRRKSWLSFL